MMWLFLLLAPDQFEATFRAGLIALNENKLPAAESQLEEASRIEPRNARVWIALAQTYSKLGKPTSADAAGRKAETFAVTGPEWRGLGTFYSGTDNHAKAVESFRKSLKADPFQEGAYFDLAQLFLKRQDFAAALDTLNAGRKYFDKSPQLELAAGVAYYALRRFPDAIEAFLHTIQLDPTIEQPYIFLGRMLDQAEDKLPRITQAFVALSERAPDHYLASFLSAKALSMQDPKQAETLLRKSIGQNGDFWESHFELGVLLDQQGQFEEAEREIRRGSTLNPNDPVPHYRLARIYDRLGRSEQARAEREIHARLSAAGAPGMAGIK
jgi:Flp pilus assembly protein TadD